MLLIKDYDQNFSCRVLVHDANTFHRALKAVIRGEKRFHVKKGDKYVYDLEYVDNQTWAMESESFPKGKLFEGYNIYPPYIEYDEFYTERISYSLFEGKKRVWFENLNEYTVVIAGVLLRNTDIQLHFNDERIKLFYDDTDRITVSDYAPETDEEDLVRVINKFYPSLFRKNYNTVDNVGCFHNTFLYQLILDKSLEKIKYVELSAPQKEGVGSLLAMYAALKLLVKDFDVEVTMQPGCSRYPDWMLKKYFNVNMTPDDSNELNTSCVCMGYSLIFCKLFGGRRSSDYKFDSLTPKFQEDLKYYSDNVLRGRKMLGVLLRGSDYYKAGFSGGSVPATPEKSVEILEEWMEKGDYEGIALATEDKNLLEAVRNRFGNKVICIAQERYSINEFEEASTISEFDKNQNSDEEYERKLEDTTVNYFYGLYMVSRCEDIVISNFCYGVKLLLSFGEGTIKRMYCIAADKMLEEGDI